MQRRTVLAGIGTALLAGCTTFTDGGSDGGETTTETTTHAPSEKPDTKFNIEATGPETVKVVHVGNDNIGNDSTKKLAVTVNGERVPVTHNGAEATYVLADDAVLGEKETAAYNYPFSIGNVVNVAASPSDTVAVVWYPQHGEKQTLAEYTVPEPTTTTESNTETETESTETTEATETTTTTEATETTTTTDA